VSGITVAEQCYGDSVCTGVVAWRVGTAAALPATAPPKVASPASIAFVVNANRAASLTSLGGSTSTGALVTIYALNGTAFTPTGGPGPALSSADGWSVLWGPATWTAGVAADFATPLPLAAGSTTTLLVSISGAGKLTCTHSMGATSMVLLSDAALSVAQPGVLPAAGLFLPANQTYVNQTCAWTGLNLTYSLANVTCAVAPPPPPPPRPDIATSAPDALVGSLDDLLRALANPNVTAIEIKAHVPLSGTALAIALDPTTQTRTLSILGTNACETANPATPLCSLDAGGLSRVLVVTDGVTLRLGHLAFRNGVAPSGSSAGGCVAALCATCTLTIDASSFTNCTASGTGGGLALYGGGSVTLTASSFVRNVAAHGGGMWVRNGNFSVTNTRFSANVARAPSASQPAPSLPVGPSGGGLKLELTTGTLDGCTFENNTAATTDFVLVANPDLPQARGGGLFVSGSIVTVGTTTFSRNAAFYGGGVYAGNSTLALRVCALSRNVATLGDGGGVYAQDCKVGVTVTDTLVSANTAGGHIGGGLAVMGTSPLTLLRSTFTDNAAVHGCGGGAGLDTGATLTVQTGNAFSRNTAFDGGAVCCVLCANAEIFGSSLFNNVATSGSGGAILSSASTLLNITNVSLFGNTAPQGGAISAISSKLTLTSCSLVGNSATLTHGGAIMHTAYDDGRQDMALTSTIFANNSCKAGGGAVAAFSTRTLAVLSCSFDNNTIYSAAPSGGALMLLTVGRLFMHNCTLTYNKIAVIPALTQDAPLGYVSGVNSLGIGLGGGMWIGSRVSCTAVITGTTFTRNGAPSAGAIYMTGTVKLNVVSSFFYHDHASDYGGRGGGIVTDATTILQVTDTLFFSCEANKGGACYHGGSSIAVYTSVTFEENEGVPVRARAFAHVCVHTRICLQADTGSTTLRWLPRVAQGTTPTRTRMLTRLRLRTGVSGRGHEGHLDPGDRLCDDERHEFHFSQQHGH
jgi:hypothetical protein